MCRGKAVLFADCLSLNSAQRPSRRMLKDAPDTLFAHLAGPSASAYPRKQARKQACGGGHFVYPPKRDHSRRIAKGIICSLPDVIDRMACEEEDAPVDGDREGSTFFNTAHDSFMFDESDVDMASSVDLSEASSPPESLMGDYSEAASPGKQSAQPRGIRWPKLFRLDHLLRGCFTDAGAHCQEEEAVKKAYSGRR